jgi:alpha-galactosidase
VGVELSGRTLQVAELVSICSHKEPFAAARDFCAQMCDTPVLPSFPVYGGNNWYYAYGESSYREIMDDTARISQLASNRDNRPFMVIDDGWQICHSSSFNGGPWKYANSKFVDMQQLAVDMKEEGVRPGIWYRPLLTAEKVERSLILHEDHSRQFLDPSTDGVLEMVRNDIKRMKSWGYELIKHDFSTFDIFGRWGFEMKAGITDDGWSFSDRHKTTAEIIAAFYKTIREAAGQTLIIGCNTVSHLAAGNFALQSTGDDTSGVSWERTRKMGINTLAFRMPQHETFYAADADCVGLTRNIPWKYNRQWLNLLAKSGTSLFVSLAPDACGSEQEKEVRKAFDLASARLPAARPLDWLI